MKKKTRTISGVTPVAVLTKPYPCPGECIFCPNEKGMPKSYLASEPGAQRAVANKFDPYLQVFNRLKALKNIGHPVDKVELIILGGSWSAYPKDYQVWFVKRCFDAMNDFSGSRPTRARPGVSLSRVQRINEKAESRCVGLAVETRPDLITQKEIIRIRKLGATKVQIGIQSLDDKVLKLNKRGHTTKETTEAIGLLRSAGFKIHVHWMPNLYGSSVEKDIKDFQKLFNDKKYKPDELKIYPCSLLKSAELMSYYKKGLWKPYTKKELLRVLAKVFELTPRYCRITRVIRDIPSPEIVVGNKKTNFRQIVEEYLRSKNIKSEDIRAREIRDKRVSFKDLKLNIVKYNTSVSREYFLEYITDKDEIVGFLRLSLSKDTAMIREVHVYGQSMEIGKKREGKAQHVGLGKSLIKKALEIAKENSFRKVLVISSVGTREYYRKLGFKDDGLYQSIHTQGSFDNQF